MSRPAPPVPAPGRLPMALAEVTWHPTWMEAPEADTLFHRLLARTPWTQPTYAMRGRAVPMPRQVAWYGAGPYSYSGIAHAPLPFTPTLDALRQRLTRSTGAEFNSVLINRYRHGQDSVAWHADDEPELGPAPIIASLSLGAPRLFQFKANQGGDKLTLMLTSGSLLVMAGATQHHWVHQIPKTAAAVGERINLTFRWVFTDENT